MLKKAVFLVAVATSLSCGAAFAEAPAEGLNPWLDASTVATKAARSTTTPYAGASQGQAYGRNTRRTNDSQGKIAGRTSTQSPFLPQATSGMPFVGTFSAPANIALQNLNASKLPPTRMDSFVAESGFNDHIYGDEGTFGPPPYESFERWNRIENGILGARDAGLTTNHGSMLPAAWGKDEFIGGPEWSMSGPHGRTTAIPAPYRPVPQREPRTQPSSETSGSTGDAPPENQGPQLPPGHIGVYQHGVYLGSYDPSVDDFESYLQREHPRSYRTLLSETGR